MQRRDLLIAGALLLAAVASAIGVATYEDDRVAVFDVDWIVREQALDVPIVPGVGAGDTELEVQVDATNLTQAAWSVRVSGGAARLQPVAVRVEITSPEGETQAADGELPVGATASIEVPLTFELAELPATQTLPAPTLEAARASVNATHATSVGVGTWRVLVTIAPTAPGPLGGAEQFEVAPTATLTTYEAEVTPQTPEVSRG